MPTTFSGVEHIYNDMTPSDIRQLVKEEVAKVRLNEALISLEHLHDGVSTSSETGKAWFGLINSLEAVINQTKDFKSTHLSAHHGPMPNCEGAMVQLQMVAKLLNGVKPVVLGMDDIERHDV